MTGTDWLTLAICLGLAGALWVIASMIPPDDDEDESDLP